MGKISTKELFDRYFDTISSEQAVKLRAQIDKPELYQYEMKIGKELIDMDVDDIFGLIFEMKNKRNGKEVKYMIFHSSFDQFSSLLRNIFNYYIDNVEPIRNPWYDKRLKGTEATKRLAQGRKPFRWEDVEKIISKIHAEHDEERADYIELILLMFYCGFSKAEEIVNLKESMINHRKKQVTLPGRVIQLSNRCYSLLVKFNKMTTFPAWRGEFILSSWNDSYFKFVIRPSQADEINNRPMNIMCNFLNRYITVNINNKYETMINYKILYLLGFYDFIVKKHGEANVERMITSYRNSEDVSELMTMASEYGLSVNNISHLKRELRPFIIGN